MKNDMRVRYTQSVIQAAFLELLKEKPISRITVKEVCDRAQINRGTFYKHYPNCYALMEALKAQAMNQFDDFLAESVSGGSSTPVLPLLKFLQTNQAALEGIARNNGDPSFLRELMLRYLQRMEALVPGETSPQEALRSTRLRVFLAGGCGAIVDHWMQSGMQEPPEQLAAEITALVDTLHQKQTP